MTQRLFGIRSAIGSAVAAIALAAGLQLQAQTSAPQTPPAPVTLIGCIARAPQATAATSTVPATPAPFTPHILTDTQAGGGSPVVDRSGGRATSTPTPPAKPAMVVEHQYWLKAPATIALAQYENQRVEVVGTLAAEPAATGASAAGTRGQTPPTGTAKDRPTSVLTLTSVKVLSTECK